MTPDLILSDRDCSLTLVRNFKADVDFTTLLSAIQWEQHQLRIFGKEIPEPRLSMWYGPPYKYSGRLRAEVGMPGELNDLLSRISAYCDFEFNSVLANLYRDGQDSMGWHADNEPEIDQRLIASFSLGAERTFAVRNKRKERTNILLPSQSLLLMNNFQSTFQHAVPKTKKLVGRRINLTFRRIKIDEQY